MTGLVFEKHRRWSARGPICVSLCALIACGAEGEPITAHGESTEAPTNEGAGQEQEEAAEQEQERAAETSAHYEDSPCLPEGGNASWQSTLMRLDAARSHIASFEARQLGEQPPPDCMTSVWLAADPQSADVVQLVHEDFRERERDFQRAERARERDFKRELVSETVWLRGFVAEASQATVGGRTVTFAREPGFSERVRNDSEVDAGAPQYCLVVDAEMTRGGAGLWCGAFGGTRQTARFYVALEGDGVVERLGSLAKGDVVQFRDHLWLAASFHRGSTELSHWVFGEVPADSVSIESRSTCCAR